MNVVEIFRENRFGGLRGAFLVLCLLGICSFGVVTNVWADDDDGFEGYGTGGYGVRVGCNTYPHAIRIWCGGDSGGASWHIYNISSPPNNNGPRYETSLNFLSEGTYDGKLPEACSSIGAEYYVAYVFDGRDGVGGDYATYGPIGYPYHFSSGREPEYNTYRNVSSFSVLEDYIKSGVDVNAWRLSPSAALEAYQTAFPGRTSISPNVGYFCPKLSKVTLKGKAMSLETRKAIGHDDPEAVTVKKGESASIEAKTIKDYKFVFWTKDKSDASVFNRIGLNEKYTESKLEKDTTVYAYYSQVAQYLGQSNVSLRSTAYSVGENDYAASGINPLGLGTVKAEVSNSRSICVGETTKTNLTFSHSLFSSFDNVRATARVVTSFPSGGYTMKNAGSSSESTGLEAGAYTVKDVKAFPDLQNPFYYDMFREDGTFYTDGGGWKYFHRDFAEVTFSEKGLYKFCETLMINNQPVSMSCANITVTDENCGQPTTPSPVPSDCGAWTPDTYTSSNSTKGTTSVVSKVRNNTVSGDADSCQLEDGWGDCIYAKPEDDVEWIHCYYPGVQKAAFTEVTTNRDDDEPYIINGGTTNLLDYSDFSDSKNGLWENKYTISTSATSKNRTRTFSTPKVPGSVTKENDIGNSNALSFTDDSYRVDYKREGDNLTETNTPGSPVVVKVDDGETHSWRCNPYSCPVSPCSNPEGCGSTTCYNSCSHRSPGYIDSSKTESSASSASSAVVKVPYNFRNDVYGIRQVGFNASAGENVVYAGEEATFKFTMHVGPRDNGVTVGNYATMVPTATRWLDVWLEGHKDETKSTAANSSTLNGQSNPSGASEDDQFTVNIPDVAAGSRVCVQAWLSPSESNGDTDMSGGNGMSTDSEVRCYVVAKRPSMEVWGGNVYSSGSISTSTANKKHLAAYPQYPYLVEGNSYGHFYFGSWNDSGIIASGGVSGFSSGATLGGLDLYGSAFPNPFGGTNNNDPLVNRPGGGKDTSFCPERSPLTFSNNCRESGAIGDNDMVVGSIIGDKEIVSSKFIYASSDSDSISGNVDLGNNSLAKWYAEDGVYYYYGGNNELTVKGFDVGDNYIRVVYSKKDITIDGNLKYVGSYGTYSEMPKLVIYADGDIKIQCGVSRIDGILIAGGTVTTCNDAISDVSAGIKNDKKRSNQLIINGAVIANSLVPGRTYGAATGANSIVPAEIISFDPSLYLWSGGNKGTATSDGGGTTSEMMLEGSRSLNVTYQKELAPRL